MRPMSRRRRWDANGSVHFGVGGVIYDSGYGGSYTAETRKWRRSSRVSTPIGIRKAKYKYTGLRCGRRKWSASAIVTRARPVGSRYPDAGNLGCTRSRPIEAPLVALTRRDRGPRASWSRLWARRRHWHRRRARGRSSKCRWCLRQRQPPAHRGCLFASASVR